MNVISQTKEDGSERSIKTINNAYYWVLMLQIVTMKHREAVLTLSILTVLLLNLGKIF